MRICHIYMNYYISDMVTNIWRNKSFAHATFILNAHIILYVNDIIYPTIIVHATHIIIYCVILQEKYISKK